MVKVNTFSCTIEKKTHNFTLPWKFWNCRGIFDIYRIRLLIDDTFTKKKSSKKKNSREHLYSHLTFCFYVVTNRRQLLNLLLTDIWYKNIQWESLTSFYFLWLPRSKLIQHCTPSASERKKKKQRLNQTLKKVRGTMYSLQLFFLFLFFPICSHSLSCYSQNHASGEYNHYRTSKYWDFWLYIYKSCLSFHSETYTWWQILQKYQLDCFERLLDVQDTSVMSFLCFNLIESDIFLSSFSPLFFFGFLFPSLISSSFLL